MCRTKNQTNQNKQNRTTMYFVVRIYMSATEYKNKNKNKTILI
jgi:hypothetical protein